MRYPKELNKLIDFFRKLPGVGKKSAERYAFDLLKWQDKSLIDFAATLGKLKLNITTCPECGALKEHECSYCDIKKRDVSILCIVSSVKDIFVIEETRLFQGIYHVLPHLLSPLEERSITETQIALIKNRIEQYRTKEIVLALDATLEGDATSLYLKQQLSADHLFISRLALGIPIGSSLDFVDEGTLSRAFSGRNPY
ncbi:MAG: recombination protein RecR [Chlamydiales bacterium]|nr:recombination protein RecR [Chlamydiales bacterium]